MDDITKMNKAWHDHTEKKLKESKYYTLVEQYPDVFRQEESSLPFPYYLFGFEIGEGWFKILEVLAAKINFELLENPELKDEFFVTQIKEKFGGLRFYAMGATEEIDNAITEAMDEAWVVCELCGEDGKQRDDNGWYMVRCDKCWDLYVLGVK